MKSILFFRLPPFRRYRFCCIVLWLCLVLINWPGPLAAQSASIGSDTLRVHKLGLQLYDSGRYQKSLQLFGEAGEAYEKGMQWVRLVELKNNTVRSLIKLGEYGEALEYANEALAIGLKHLNAKHPLIAVTNDNIGHVYSRNKQAAKSLEHHKKALVFFLGLDNGTRKMKHLADVYHNLGFTYTDMRERDSAIHFLKLAIDIKRQYYGEESKEVALTYNALGILYEEEGEFEEMLDYHKKSLDIRLKVLPANHGEILESYINIGNGLMGTGDYAKAMEYNINALNIAEGVPEDNQLTIGHIYNNLGLAFYYIGDYGRSIEYFNKSLNVKSKLLGEHHPLVGDAYLNLGGLHGILKNYEQSIAFSKKALDIRLKFYNDEHYAISEIYNNLGVTYNSMGNYDSAISFHHQALASRIKLFGKQHYSVALSYNNLGVVYEDAEDLKGAISFHNKALDIRKKWYGEKHLTLYQTYMNLGSISSKMTFYEQAVQYYHKAIMALIPVLDEPDWRINPKLDQNTKSVHDLMYLFGYKAYNLKKIYEEQSHDIEDLKLAISTYQLAMDVIQAAMNSFTNQDSKSFFLNNAQEVYKGAAEACLLYGLEHPKDSVNKLLFTISENSRASLLSEAMHEFQLKNFVGIVDSLISKENDLKNDISAYETEIHLQKLKKEGYDTMIVRASEQQLFELRREHEGLIAFFERQYPQYYRLKYQDQTATIQEVQQLLQPSSAFIEYFVSDGHLLVFTITSDKFRVDTTPLPKGFEEQLNQLRHALSDEVFIGGAISQSTEAYLHNAYQLYQLLLQRQLKRLGSGIKHLIMAPDGLLATIPFEILLTSPLPKEAENRDNGVELFRDLKYLLTEYDISYAYSGTLLKEQIELKRQKESPSGLFAGFAPGYEGYDIKALDSIDQPMVTSLVRSGNQELPGASTEVLKIASLLGGDTWLKEEATEGSFKSVASGYRLLHLAMHGLLDDQNPSLSKLLFTPLQDSVEDNYLHASEIYATSVNADMVVLSACNTGYGVLQGGEGIMSLSRAFAYAGCPSVVNSLWKAPDQVTSKIMIEFYKGLKQGLSKAAALRQAKLNYLKSAKGTKLHPYYWSAFVINGDASVVPMDKESGFWWSLLYVMAGVLVAVLLFYWLYPQKHRI